VFALSAGFPGGQGAVDISGPALFPNVLASVLTLCGIAQIAIGFSKSGHFEAISLSKLGERLRSTEVINVAIIVGLIVAYIALFEVLGFVLASFGFLFAVMYRLGVPALKNVLVSAAFLAVIYLIFGVLFTIRLPSGLLAFVGI
jgi:hypothetical protein